jgi:hypothetical protein
MFFYKKPPTVSSLLQSDPWTVKSNTRVFLAAGRPSPASAFAALRPPAALRLRLRCSRPPPRPCSSSRQPALGVRRPPLSLAPYLVPLPSSHTWLRFPRARAPVPCSPRALEVELLGQVLHGLEVELLHAQSSTASRSSFSTAKSSRRLAVSLPSPPQPQG